MVLCVLSCKQDNIKVKDIFEPLPPNSIRLNGYLDDYINLSMEHWNKGDLPYTEFVNFYRYGRPKFALGEMWGKAVRSGCMFYRYTQDPELKKNMDRIKWWDHADKRMD